MFEYLKLLGGKKVRIILQLISLSLILLSLIWIVSSHMPQLSSLLSPDSQLSKNLADAHIRTNGQLVLLVLLSSLLILSTHSSKVKKTIISLALLTIIFHAFAIIGTGYYSLFDSVLVVSGYFYMLISITMGCLVYQRLSGKQNKLTGK